MGRGERCPVEVGDAEASVRDVDVGELQRGRLVDAGLSGGVKEYIGRLRAGVPDLTVIVEDQVVDQDKVATRWSAHGTHAGELQNDEHQLRATPRTAGCPGIVGHVGDGADGDVVGSVSVSAIALVWCTLPGLWCCGA